MYKSPNILEEWFLSKIYSKELFLSVFLKNSSSLKDSSFRKKSFSRRTISLWGTFSFSRTCLYFGKILPIKEFLFLEEPSLSQKIPSSFRKTLPKNYYSVKNFFFLKNLSFLKNSLFRKNFYFPKNSSVLKNSSCLKVFYFINVLFKESSLSQELFLSEQLVLELFLFALENPSYLKYPLSLESSTSSGC